MQMVYRHSLESGSHTFYEGVVEEPTWDAKTHKLQVTLADGDVRIFGPEVKDMPIAYGRLLGIDPETGKADITLANYTFYPVGK